MRGTFYMRQFDAVISYDWDDRDIVLGIAERLKKGGINVWLDQWFMMVGVDMLTDELRALEATRVLILIVGSAPRTTERQARVSYAGSRVGEQLLPRADVVHPVILPGATHADIPDGCKHLDPLRMEESSASELDKVS